MSATWSFDEQPRTGDPLLPGASPAAIRAGLLTEDQGGFDTAYADALGAAREQLDLTELLRCLEHWRRRALLQRDPDGWVCSRAAVYEVTTDEQSRPQIEALPAAALPAAALPFFAEARAALEVSPWNGTR